MPRILARLAPVVEASRNVSLVVLTVAACALAVSSCGSDESTTDVKAVVPRITSLSSTVLAPGDTVEITGSNFATPASGNVVVFNNSLGSVSPFAASDTLIRAEVPQNAASGPLYVTSKGVKSNSVVVTIERGVGDVWVMGGGSVVQFKVPVETGTEEYLIVPEPATSTGANYTFQVTPDTASVYPAPPMTAAGASRGTVDRAIEFESSIREQSIEYLRTHGPRKPGPIPQDSATEPPATAQFYVLDYDECCDIPQTCPPGTNCSSVSLASNFTVVNATLHYNGTHVLVYADDNQPAGSFTPGEFAAFGAQFNDETYLTNTAYFGDPTDIDHNDKIIVLFTPLVNELTADDTAALSGFISGFFLVNDLAPTVFPAGTSNSCEIFYTMVPDPTAEYGNAFSQALVEEVVPGTLAHEFEHMISIGYRLVELGNGTDPRYIQQLWLEEGMAHMAEDLNDMDSQNIARGSLFLDQVYMHSLLGNAEIRPYVDTLQQRGGIYLFLRYLGDQLGEQIFKTMVQGPELGTATVQKVTQKEFYSSVADYLAALYLDDRDGVPHDPRYQYSSLNIRSEFLDTLTVTNRDAQAGAFNGAVRSATGNFFRIAGGEPPALEVRVSSSSASQMRVVVVRIR